MTYPSTPSAWTSPLAVRDLRVVGLDPERPVLGRRGDVGYPEHLPAGPGPLDDRPRDDVGVLARQLDVAVPEADGYRPGVLGADGPLAPFAQFGTEVHLTAGETDGGEDAAGTQQPASALGGRVFRGPHACLLTEAA